MSWLPRTGKARGAFRVVTFHTEGPPHDRGRPLVEVEQAFRERVEPVADEYLAYSPRRLGDLRVCADYTDWLGAHPRVDELRRHNEDWARLGFQMWKPYLLQTVVAGDAVEPGDIVLYHDVDLRKYPTYADDVGEWRGLSARILDSVGFDVYVPPGFAMGRDVKAWLMRRYLDDSYRTRRGLHSFVVLVRKSQSSLEFLRDWWELSRDLDNISPLPNPDPYPETIWNSVDQATLAVVAERWRSNGRLPAGWPVYNLEDLRLGSRSIRPGIGYSAAVSAYVRGSLSRFRG